MGYYVKGAGHIVFNSEDRKQAAFKALCELNKRDDLKEGGSYEEGAKVESWFSWMDSNYDKEARDLDHILEMLGFNIVNRSDDGLILIVDYDNKMGQEDLFLQTMAPFVAEMKIYWMGEDGRRWNILIENGSTIDMGLGEAVQIVMDLARQNIVDERDMATEHKKQTIACNIVEDFFVNNVFL